MLNLSKCSNFVRVLRFYFLPPPPPWAILANFLFLIYIYLSIKMRYEMWNLLKAAKFGVSSGGRLILQEYSVPLVNNVFNLEAQTTFNQIYL